MTPTSGLSASLDGEQRDDATLSSSPSVGRSRVLAPSTRLAAVTLLESRAYCEALTRAQARNFYYGLKLLPEPKRSDMFALYAYMRLIDDIADEDADGRTYAQRTADLEAWGVVTRAVLGVNGHAHHPGNGNGNGNGNGHRHAELAAGAGHEIWPAFADMSRRNRLPAHLFDDVIAGQLQDLRPAPFETFSQLHEYCYRVAGTVGLASIYVWGFDGSEHARELAIRRGIAFQLTNILRDLREDAARGRIYLPREDLDATGVSEDDILAGRGGGSFENLMRMQLERAESYYASSAPLESHISADSRPTLVAMTQIYHGLLRKVAQDPQRVLRERVSLSIFRKVLIGWRASWASRGRAGCADRNGA
jgi:15-cis-phytoene synthase